MKGEREVDKKGMAFFFPCDYICWIKLGGGEECSNSLVLQCLIYTRDAALPCLQAECMYVAYMWWGGLAGA